MKRFFLALVGIAALVASTYLLGLNVGLFFSENKPLAENEASLSPPVLKVSVPELELVNLAGKNIPLAGLKGKVFLLNFWASWCPPCVQEFPSLVKLVEKSAGKIDLVAVSQDKDAEVVENFFKSIHLTSALRNPNVIILLDPRGKVSSERFSVHQLPETFLIGRDFKILRKISGSVDWLSPELIDIVNKAISGE